MIQIHSSAEKVFSELVLPANSIGIRISVRSAGCNGHSYVMEWAYKQEEGDHVLVDLPITIYIDRKSSIFLFGSELQYKVEQFQEGFEFVNPNETSKCGCGESFYVA